MILRATETFITFAGGRKRTIKAGALMNSDDPLASANVHRFEPVVGTGGGEGSDEAEYLRKRVAELEADNAELAEVVETLTGDDEVDVASLDHDDLVAACEAAGVEVGKKGDERLREELSAALAANTDES